MILLQSFLFVLIAEMGDKTQLLTLVLLKKFRKPWPIFLGIFLATLVNHGLASYAGGLVSRLLPEDTLRWVLAFSFFACAAWVLVPDKDTGISAPSRWGALVSTTLLFFVAEMGDKTQVVTVALGAETGSPLLVTFGSTAGMLAANGLALVFGLKFLERVPLQWFHRGAALLFALFGLSLLLS